jgi:aspartyl/asparaginyl beta-hydroxylase (cupin superfamily)
MTFARIRRIIAALLRKAAASRLPHEATACREKAEALREVRPLAQMNRSSRPAWLATGPGRVLIGSSHRLVRAEWNGSSPAQVSR